MSLRRVAQAPKLAAALLGALAFVYRPLLEGRVLAGRDVFRIFIPDGHLLRAAWAAGELPLWNPYVRLGQPLAATLQSQAFYPPRLLALLMASPVSAVTVEHLLHVLLAAWGMFLFCRRLGTSRLAAGLGAVAWGLGPFFTQLAFLPNITAATTWTGFMGAQAVALSRRPSLGAVAGLATFGALALLTGSPEMQLWQGALLAVLVLRGTQRVRGLGALALAGGWAVALAAVVLVPALEMLTLSTRTGGVSGQFNWSLSPSGLLAMVLPGADLPRGGYWEEGNLFHHVFLGSTVVGLALLGLRRKRLWPLAVLALALAVLSLGRFFPPSHWLLGLPPFSLFRYPAKYTVGVAFLVTALAAPGLDRVRALARSWRPPRRWLLVPLFALALTTAVLVSFAPALGLREGFRGGAIWAATFGATALALCFLIRGEQRPSRLPVALLIVCALELVATHLLVGMPMWFDRERLSRPSALATALGDERLFRVSVVLDDEEANSGPGASHAGAFVEASRELLVPMRNVEEGLAAVEGNGAPVLARYTELMSTPSRAVYDLIGARDFVRLDGPPFEDLQPVATLEPAMAWRSRTAVPVAFLVHEAHLATDGEALEALRAETQPMRTHAWLAEGAPLTAGPGCEEEHVSLVERRLTSASFDVEACASAYLILSEMHYPGWRAEEDGQPVLLHRANYFMRAVPVTPGHHRVTLRYQPASFRWGACLSGVALLALVVALWRARSPQVVGLPS